MTIYPVPKPPVTAKTPKRLARSPLKKSTKRIPKVNVAKQAKRRARQIVKHRAYMRSETRKIVDARAYGRCEATVFLIDSRRIALAPHWPRMIQDDVRRCTNDARTHHHLTYARYGGNELPEDMLKVCDRCNEYLESQHPTRRRGK